MEIGFDEAIAKIDKTLKLGQLFSVVGGEIFFCIYATNSDVNNINQQENNSFDEQVSKRFENNFNTRFTNMEVTIKIKPVRVEFVGNCNSKSAELEIIKHYRSNPNFINLVDENKSIPSNENNRYIYVRLYSLPKEWSMTYAAEKSFEHSHTHTHEHGHGHHHHHHHDHHDHHHDHQNGHHHHHEDDHSNEHGHSHTHTHTHSHPGSEETYQCMNFH
ncbi:hypothetical protein ACTA71_004867 [Dictyostelium dimigraforme]